MLLVNFEVCLINTFIFKVILAQVTQVKFQVNLISQKITIKKILSNFIKLNTIFDSKTVLRHDWKVNWGDSWSNFSPLNTGSLSTMSH